MKYFATLLIVSISFASLSAQEYGGGEFPYLPQDEITPQQRAEIWDMIHLNIAMLKAEGKITDNISQKTTAVEFEFPLGWADGFTGYNFYGISNFVDQNAVAPGSLLDYNCGTRTYDTDGGYNHQGIDYFLWPFDWNLMIDGAVKVVAAAPGMIVSKTDGNFDQNCAFNNSSWNAIYVRHDDGSISWYGHMKNGSLTTKGLGDMVETGEFLGLVGSSGNSTGPHLHFETYDTDDNLIDPFAGECNSMNDDSWWAEQEPYYNTQINKMQTHSAPPVFNPCPAPADTYEENHFDAGETVYFALYARDLRDIDLCQLKIEMPDGTAWYDWEFYQPAEHFVASYWYWWYPLPEDAQDGTWKWSCELGGNTYVHEFTVGEVPSGMDQASAITDMNVFYADETITVMLQSTIPLNAAFRLFNLQGQCVAEFNSDVSAGANQITFPADRLSNGIYLMNVSDGITHFKTSRLQLIRAN